MSCDYRFVIEKEAFQFLASCRASDRRLLDAYFARLERNPFETGELRETDLQGRTIETILTGRFIVTFWADHAVKEMRIVRLEKLNR